MTDLEARLALKDAEAADLRQRLARNGTVVSDVNGGYYLVKTEPQHLFLCNTQYFLHTSKSVLNNNPLKNLNFLFLTNYVYLITKSLYIIYFINFCLFVFLLLYYVRYITVNIQKLMILVVIH